MARILFLCALVVTTYLFISCKESSMPFNKDTWMRSEDECYMIIDNNRYKMALWLEENYTFCGKELSEINDTFFNGQLNSEDSEESEKDKKVKLVTRQKNPNFIIGIDPWINTDWIELHFDKDNCVSKAYMVKYNPKTKKRTERIICGG